MSADYQDYGFRKVEPNHMHRRFMPVVLKFAQPLKPGTRLLDVGCGNGSACGKFIDQGCQVVGVDLSRSGIEIARKTYPAGRFEMLAADDKILENLQEPPFDLVFSSEVVEHLYAPRPFVKGCFTALKPGGRFILTTPYHGYWKNLVLAILGKWERHLDPLWDGGHIKIWSRATITELLEEAGFRNIRIQGVGRFPGLWMTMVVAADKP